MEANSRHGKMERSGLLGGRLDDDAREDWPEWARTHFGRCPSCRSLAAADLAATLAGEPIAAPLPPAAGFAALIARGRRPAPSLASVLRPSGRAMPKRYRDRRAQTLELACEGAAMRAFDPTARQLLVLALGEGGRARVLLERRTRAPGHAALVHWREQGDVEIVAVASPTLFDSALLILWLGEWGAEASARLAAEADGAGLRVAVRRVPQRLRPQRLRVTSRELPAADEEIRAIFREGHAAGVADRQLEAVGHYRRGLVLAMERGDVSGRVKASVGLAILLDDLGYRDDALRVLAEVAESAELDREHAAMVSLSMVHRCRGAGLIEEAEGWLVEAEANSDPGEPLLVFARIGIAMEREEFAKVLALAEHPRLGELRPEQQTLLAALRAVAAVRMGDRRAARRGLDGVQESGFREIDVWLALARWMAADDGDHALHEASFVDASRRALAVRAEDVITIWVALAVATALPALVARGSTGAAWALARLVFLPEPDASDPSVRLVGLIGGERSSWLIGPTPASVARIPVGTSELATLTGAMREECAVVGRDPVAHRAVSALLGSPRGRVNLASTHSLHDLCARFPGGDLLVRCILPGVRPVARQVGGDLVVSVADPFGDLPGAHAEVPREACGTWLRGTAARRGSLRELGPGVGLLHLGLHGSRQNGLPELLFADGPLTPPEVEAIGLPSHPVVLLSGCSTAVRTDHLGVEQSFAAAFLRAGAAAVICTRIPVPDREMAIFVSRLVARWPFGDGLRAVGSVCAELIREGSGGMIVQSVVVY